MDIITRGLSCSYKIERLRRFRRLLLQSLVILGIHGKSSWLLDQSLYPCTHFAVFSSVLRVKSLRFIGKSLYWSSVFSSYRLILRLIPCSQRCRCSRQRNYDFFNIIFVKCYKNLFESNKTCLTRLVILEKWALIATIIRNWWLVELIIRADHHNHT